MGKFIDLTGKRFGRLTVIKRVENDNQKKPQWRCKCDCGNETIARANSLRLGLSYQTVYARLTKYRLSVEEAFERK